MPDDTDGVTTIAERRAQERIANQRGVDPSEVQDVELDAQGRVTDARLSSDARLRLAAEESDQYSRDDLRVEDGEVRARPEARKRAIAEETEYERDELRIKDGEVRVREPTEQVDLTLWEPDDASGEVAWVGPDGQRIETGAEAGATEDDPYFARVDVPDKEGTWRLQVGGETVDRVDVGRPGVQQDVSEAELNRGWNANVITVDAESGTGSASESESAYQQSASTDEDVVAGGGAAEALQAGAAPERLSPTNPISGSEGDAIAEALEQQQDVPTGNPAMRGTEANTQLRQRLAEQDGDINPDDIDVVYQGNDLRARIEGDARSVDPETATQQARDRGVGDEPEALQRLDGDADRGVSITRPGGQGGVVTGAPDAEPQLTIEEGQADRGVGVTRGPEGTTVVRPDGADAAPAAPTDATPWTQAQRDASVASAAAQQRAAMRTAMARVDGRASGAGGRGNGQPPLIEPERDYSAIEVLSGQAAADDPQFEQAAINDVLGAAGVADAVGFREPTREQVGPEPGGESALRYARGAGPRRQYQVEAEGIGRRVGEIATNPGTQAAATVGVAAPEPSTTLGGAAILATGAVAAAAAQQQQDRSAATSPFADEAEVPDEQDQSELEVPEDGAVNELDVPEGQQKVSPSELGVPEEAFQPDETGEIPADISGGARITDDGDVELPAEASGVVVYRDRSEEEEEDDEDAESEDEDEEEETEEEEVVVEVPENLIPDEEVTLGEEAAEPETEEIAEPTAMQGQEDAELDDEQADESFDEDLFWRPRQGQQSDAAEPETTGVEEVDPPSDEDAVLDESVEQPLSDQSGTLGGVIGGSGGGLVGGGVAARDRDAAGVGARPDTGSDVRDQLDSDIGADVFDATATDAALESTARADAAIDSQLDSALDSATASMSTQQLQTAQQSQLSEQTQTQPQQQETTEEMLEETFTEFTPEGGQPPNRLRRPDRDDDDEDSSSFLDAFGVDDRVFDTGVVQTLEELDDETANPDPFEEVDDAIDDLNF